MTVFNVSCFLAVRGRHERGDMPSCDGRLVRCHLIKQQVLKRAGVEDVWDPAWWVWACGGPQGQGGHHGMLDQSRKIRLDRNKLPVALEVAAANAGLTWWLDREYGPR